MIYGERVRLRRLERGDLPRFVEWLNDPAVREGIASIYPIGMAHEEEWFESTLKQEPASQPFALEALVPPAAEPPAWTHIGAVGFHQVDWRNRVGEMGIVIGDKAFWGRGYGTDATRALVGWGFSVLNLNRVELRVFDDNARAIRCYEKIGFRTEGRLRQDRFWNGRYYDTLVMGLLRDELRG